MPDQSRIDELRGRVESDPASIAFAQLAEEYRRAGDFQEAVRICRAGLAQHPAYLSARVTLGRALLELEKYDEAQAEFEHVLLSAPDNLIAIRSMADLHQRRGDRDEMGDVGDSPVSHAVPERRADPVIDVPAEPLVAETADPVLVQLESWLAAILDDRASRAAS